MDKTQKEKAEKAPVTFDDFIALIKEKGITAERRGKYMRFKMQGQKAFTRLERLGEGYTEANIRDRISGR